MQSISEVNARIDAAVQEIAQIAGAVGTQVHAAVGSLQFQDITSQLVQHIECRSVAVRDAVQGLTGLALAAAPGIAGAQARLERSMQALNALSSRNPVANSQMASGLVDLF